MGKFSRRFVGYMDIKGKHRNILSCLFLLRQKTAVIFVHLFPRTYIAFAAFAAHTIHGPMTLEIVHCNSCAHFIKNTLFCQEKYKEKFNFLLSGRPGERVNKCTTEKVNIK